ncbi:MAG: hypothetical protein HQ477_02060 [Chloroflexi bacterium]|nr:hypothetical protein [Chloroflexota bacterium]
MLKITIEAFRADHDSILDHSVSWNPSSWAEVPHPELSKLVADLKSWKKGSSDVSAIISRRDVVQIGVTPGRLFLASMIWGFGTTGYGASRTSDMISGAGADFERKISAIIAGGQESPQAAWDAILGETHVKGLGVAFGTKLAYFASLQSNSESPVTLIADINTSWGIWDLDNEIKRSVEVKSSYLNYVEKTQAWAGECYRSDEIEYALFRHGQNVRRQLKK